MKTSGISRRGFLCVSASGLAGVSLRKHIAHADNSPVWEKQLVVKNTAAIRLLQFTDIHFFLRADTMPLQESRRRQMTLDDGHRLIDLAKPDALLVTGDLWHDNPDGRGAEFMAYAAQQCAAWGVPWVFTWGNHDQMDDYAVGHATMTQAKNSYYAGADSEGNYVLSLMSSAGARLAEIFCLNTRAVGLQTEAHAFVREAAATLDKRGERPLRLGAFHIPLRQYQDVWENGTARGVIGENVCYEEEDRSSLPILRQAGIQTVFCGHDHVNDYEGALDGVKMVYGRATGHNGYGAAKLSKGAKLYILDPARKTIEWKTVLPNGDTWLPDADERRDERAVTG